jgi:hypothetical protein
MANTLKHLNVRVKRKLFTTLLLPQNSRTKMGPEELTEVSSAGAVLVSVKVGKLLRSHARALHLPVQIFYI